MKKWVMPTPLPIDWTMRDTTSATITVQVRENGRLEQRIEHALLPGVTPEMLLWMLENLGREIVWRGQRCIIYRWWHPTDHIHFEVLGPFGPGCRFHVVEAFQASPKLLMDSIFDVPKLDRTGFRLELRRFGRLAASMDEEWDVQPGGLRYRVRQIVGFGTPGSWPVNRMLRWKDAALLQAWQLHNVQEVGNLPHILPTLYSEFGS